MKQIEWENLSLKHGSFTVIKGRSCGRIVICLQWQSLTFDLCEGRTRYLIAKKGTKYRKGNESAEKNWKVKNKKRNAFKSQRKNEDETKTHKKQRINDKNQWIKPKKRLLYRWKSTLIRKKLNKPIKKQQIEETNWIKVSKTEEEEKRMNWKGIEKAKKTLFLKEKSLNFVTTFCLSCITVSFVEL